MRHRMRRRVGADVGDAGGLRVGVDAQQLHVLGRGAIRRTAFSKLVVVSGQIVLQRESTKASRTALPRNWLSETGWPD